MPQYRKRDIGSGDKIILDEGGMPIGLGTDASGDDAYFLQTDKEGNLSEAGKAAVRGAVGFRSADDQRTLAFPHIGRLTGRSLTTSITATPLALASGTEIYIDFNRGSDANPGTRTQPKKSISVLHNQNYGAGTVIALASDSLWDVSTHVLCSTMKGSAGNPLIFTGYDPAGNTGTRPRISYKVKTLATDWVYDAARNGWRWTQTPNYPGPMTVVFFGPLKLHGVRIWQDENHPAFLGDMQWGVRTNYSTYAEIWVYAPANTNPVDYYGDVYITPGNRATFHSAWDGLSHTEFDGIEFVDQGCGIGVSSSNGTTAHTGLVVKNCKGTRAQIVEVSHPGSNTGAHTFSAYDNVGEDLPVGLIKFGGGGTMTAEVTRNSVDGCNKQYSALAAIYVQSVATNLGDVKVHRNYIKGAVNGTGSELGAGYGCAFDGAAIYADLGADKTLIYANVMERCGKPIQSNSAKTVQVIANVAIDCEVFSSHTDAGNAGSNNVTVAHNTFVSRLPVGSIKTGRSVPNGNALSTWFETSTGGNTLRIINNALITSSQRAGVAVRVAAEAATQTVAGNAITGWSDPSGLVQEKSLTNSTVTDRTSTGAVITSGSVSSWFKDGGAVPGLDSPLAGAGTRSLVGLRDLNGDEYERFPTIGAVVAA